jgi:Ran GTPase-activating protein (RanGAP) involved in mRNA processing and transport
MDNILYSLEHAKGLCGLYLYREFTLEDVMRIARALQHNTTLLDLRFLSTNNEFGPPVAAVLANALKVNRGLQTFGLPDHNIRDEGARLLAEMLRVNTTLQRMDLSRNNIGQPGMDALARALEKNTTLMDLDLRDNLSETSRSIDTMLQRNRTLYRERCKLCGLALFLRVQHRGVECVEDVEYQIVSSLIFPMADL